MVHCNSRINYYLCSWVRGDSSVSPSCCSRPLSGREQRFRSVLSSSAHNPRTSRQKRGEALPAAPKGCHDVPTPNSLLHSFRNPIMEGTSGIMIIENRFGEAYISFDQRRQSSAGYRQRQPIPRYLHALKISQHIAAYSHRRQPVVDFMPALQKPHRITQGFRRLFFGPCTGQCRLVYDLLSLAHPSGSLVVINEPVDFVCRVSEIPEKENLEKFLSLFFARFRLRNRDRIRFRINIRIRYRFNRVFAVSCRF